MICTAPCMDCPFLRNTTTKVGWDDDIFGPDSPQSFWFYYMIEIHEYECEEQGGVCHGQARMFRHGLESNRDPFSELGEYVETLSEDHKNYFAHGSEFLRHQEDLRAKKK